MVQRTKQRLYNLLRWSERYIKTDMVYLAESNFWLLIGRFFVAGSGFLLTVVFANLLSPDAYGAYKYIIALSGFAAAFTLNGIGSAALRAIGRGYQNVVPSLFAKSLLWSIPASVGSFGLGGYYLYMGNQTLGWALIVIAILNPLMSNLAISKSLFIATGDFHKATLYNAVRTMVQTFVVIGTVLFTKNVLIITSVFFITSTFVSYITYRQSLRVMKVHDDQTHLPETLRYTKHVSIIGVFLLAAGQLDQLLLWHTLGPVALATYTIAQGPSKELRTMAENISTIVFPKFAKISAQVHVESNVVARRSLQFFLALSLVVITYIIAAPFLYAIFFPKYLSSVFYSQLFAAAALLQPRTFIDMFLLAHGNIKDRYAVAIPGVAIKIGLYLLLIPLYGVIGAIVASFLAELCTALLSLYRYFDFKRRFKNDHTL